MSSVKVACYMLLKEFHENGDVLVGGSPVKMLSIIERNSDRMLQLIDDLLDTFRYQKGGVRLNCAPFPVERMVKEIAEEFVVACQERGLSLIAGAEEGLPLLKADPVKIRQVLINLLGNAMKFTPSGGKIVIGAGLQRKGGENAAVEIFVKDSGIGIPKDHQDKIFEKFFQVDGSLTRERPGLGLGLALTRSIILAHGGAIRVESAVGQGSAFTIALPIEKTAAPHPDPEDSHVRA